jgi:hypothetical protein
VIGPTASELDALAARARQLAADIETAHARLRELDSEPIRRAAWRLEDGAWHVRQAADIVAITSEKVTFVESVRSRPHCGADWGCCPEHGATLSGSGDRCRCTARGCGRTWPASRMDLPCNEPPAFRLVDVMGKGGLLCAGHAIAARRQLIGARLLPLEGRQP